MLEWQLKNSMDPQDSQGCEKTFSKDGKDGKDDTHGLVGHIYSFGRGIRINEDGRSTKIYMMHTG